MKLRIALLLSIYISSSLAASSSSSHYNRMFELSHSGGTDKCGCHYNRKTGEYHCHKRKKRGGECPP